MTESDWLDLVQSAIWVSISVCGPVVAAVMIVGVAISLLQAVTQVQEVTLTFVPKIIVAMIVLSLSATFVGRSIGQFAEQVFSLIERHEAANSGEEPPRTDGAKR